MDTRAFASPKWLRPRRRGKPPDEAVVEGATMRGDNDLPVTIAGAKNLFADWATASALVLAVSGGPDSVAMMWLAARWRRDLRNGPRLVAVTVDHGLRKEAAREARDVKQFAKSLDLPHRTLRWTDA